MLKVTYFTDFIYDLERNQSRSKKFLIVAFCPIPIFFRLNQLIHHPSKMISAPVLFAKACEIFILEMTLRAWGAAEKSKRHTLQKEDIEAAIKNTEIFDFLVGL